MLSLLAAVMLSQADLPPPPPPPTPAADTPTPPPAPAAGNATPATAAPVVSDAPVRASYEGKSRGWLLAEKKYLEDQRPSLAPLALIAGGGAALLFTAILSAVIRPGSGGNFPLDGAVLGVFAVAGGAGMVAGGVMLFFALARAATADSDIAAVRDALDRVGDAPPPPPPADIPPAMPQVQLPPVPQIINVRVASF